MKLTAEQKKIAREIVRRGKRAGASPMEVESAIETGLVESNLRNLPGGDADSQGWRQERKSLYPNPRDVGASIDRYFRETKAAKAKGRYKNSGELAAAVQRPAAQYRGRYEQRDRDAGAILRALGGNLSGKDSLPSKAKSKDIFTRETTFDEPGFEAARRKATVAAFLEKRGKGHGLLFKTGALSSKAPDPAAFTSTRTVKDTVKVGGPKREPRAPKATPARGGKRPAGQLLELFHGKTAIKRGAKIAPVPDHDDHVHAASGPKQIAELKKLARSMGLTVTSEDEGSPGDGVHTPTSYHYKGQAIDVGGDPKKMAAFTRAVRKRYGA